MNQPTPPADPPGPDGPADRTRDWSRSPAGQMWSAPTGPPASTPPPTEPPASTPPPTGQASTTAPQIAVLVTTTDQFGDRRVLQTLGEVIGVVARSRDLPKKADPLTAYPPQLLRARQDAVAQMVTMARTAGANAVVGLRFDSSEISPTHSEVVAYGTAVIIEVNDQDRFRRHT